MCSRPLVMTSRRVVHPHSSQLVYDFSAAMIGTACIPLGKPPNLQEALGHAGGRKTWNYVNTIQQCTTTRGTETAGCSHNGVLNETRGAALAVAGAVAAGVPPDVDTVLQLLVQSAHLLLGAARTRDNMKLLLCCPCYSTVRQVVCYHPGTLGRAVVTILVILTSLQLHSLVLQDSSSPQ
jgi:hypothetical protein